MSANEMAIDCRSRKLRAFSSVFLLSTASFLLTACGHGATEAECEMVVDRNVELAMKKLAITDQTQIDKRKQEIKTELKPTIASCVGKRVTNSMMKCVQTAEAPEAIDDCMR